MSTAQKRSLWDATIVRRAVVDAMVKLHPRTMKRNTVMFVVEIGSVITTIYLVRDLITQRIIPVRPADHAVALIHGAVCQLRRGDGGRTRQGAGRCAASG